MKNLFLSYSRKDREEADWIADVLTKLKIEFFRDEKDIHWQHDTNSEINNGLNQCAAILVVLSPASIKSQWLAFEIGYATGRLKKVLPFVTDPNIEIPDFASQLNYITKANEIKEYFNSHKSLKALLKSDQIPQDHLESEYLDWWEHENVNRQDATVEFERLKLFVDKRVFSPDFRLSYSTYFTSTFLKNLENKKVLDIGTGSGVLAILASKRGAKSVTAIDIDDVAVQNARDNVKRHHQEEKVKVYQGDLFTPFENGLSLDSEKFDIVIANLPIAYSASAWSHLNITEIIKKWAKELPNYLSPEGEALFAWASFGDQDFIYKVLADAGLNYKEFTEKSFGITWQTFQISLK